MVNVYFYIIRNVSWYYYEIQIYLKNKHIHMQLYIYIYREREREREKERKKKIEKERESEGCYNIMRSAAAFVKIEIIIWSFIFVVILFCCVASTEKDMDTRLTKAWTAINRVSITWKSDLTDKMKRSFFQAAVASILLYGCTT